MENTRSVTVRTETFFLTENNLLYLTAPHDVDGAFANEIVDACIELVSSVEGKVDCLIDVGRTRNQSPETRQAWKRWSEHPKCGRLALHGLSPIARVVSTFAVGVFGNEQQKRTKFFTSEADALAWLLNNPA
jgi:hypothetical protein